MSSWGTDRGRLLPFLIVAFLRPPVGAAAPEVFAQLGHSNVVHAVVFAPGGRTLASAGEDGATNLWDISTARELRTLKSGTAGINAAAYAPDGATLVTGGREGSLTVWDVSSGQALRVLKGHTAAV
ncbi:MAG: hypothetical protein JO274_10970, partial [Gammaproteobacteria bacterium]|nr:hypothetical protein [Gammaproteobacteria bacterium]